MTADYSDTICATATPAGTGALAVVRVSGPEAIEIVSRIWRGKDLKLVKARTAHLGKVTDSAGQVLDEVVATVYRAPASYTGEDSVELTCHGSGLIRRELLNSLIKAGARAAGPGEFSKRAFLNGRIDLAQAEGIADLISAESQKAHRLAWGQTKGLFSRQLNKLRGHLIEFASLLELELDFSEEDVEFANRDALLNLCKEVIANTGKLVESYAKGKAIKEGVAVAIAGVPNAGKSTLLNALLDDERAIVSDIPGTTRDAIEGTVSIDGVLFRFVDTAGLRETTDKIEQLGIEKARKHLSRSQIVIWLTDPSSELGPQQFEEKRITETLGSIPIIKVSTKSDLGSTLPDHLAICALNGAGIEALKKKLVDLVIGDYNEDEVLVTNSRHYDALLHVDSALRRAAEGLEAGLSGDLVSQDVREAIHHLGEITGEISTNTLLNTIFSSFCIGK